MSVWWSEEGGNIGAILGPDPVGNLVDALGVFKRAFEATMAEDRKIREAELRRQGAMRGMVQRPGGPR